jgi:uncharacterized protein YdaU (DUF1376 family)
MASEPKPKFFQYCPKDLLDEVDLLDESEDLIYRRVLDLIFKSNDRLPNDDRKIASLLKIGAVRWRKAKRILVEEHELLEVVDGRITKQRCRDELGRVNELIRQKSEAGKASAEARQSRLGSAPRSEQKTPPENGGNFSANSLIILKTPLTSVGLAVDSSVPTNQKPTNQVRKDDDDGAREAHSNSGKIGLDNYRPHFVKNASASAVVSALTEVVVGVFGEEVGGMARPFPKATDGMHAERFLTLGKELGLSPEESVEAIRIHFQNRCTKMKNDGRSPPASVALFETSACDTLRSVAKAKTQPIPAESSGNSGYGGYRNRNEPAPTTSAKPLWEQVSNKLAKSGRFVEARKLSDLAGEQGRDAANLLAKSIIEAETRGKRTAA